MAYTDVTRVGTAAQKKVRSLMVLPISEAAYAEAKVSLAAGNFLAGMLPANAVVVDAYVAVRVAATTTTMTVAAGTTEGGADLLAATDLKTAGVSGALVGKKLTNTGLPVYLTLALTGGATGKYGDSSVVIVYDEITKSNGEYTRFGK